jgi:hypothetical protein
MTATPLLGMTQLASAQAAPETQVNENDLILEFFAAGAFKSRANNPAEPGSPASGDGYLLTGTPTGTHWAGQGGKIALYINTAWKFFTAKEGMKFYVNDEDVVIAYDGAAWNTTSGAAEATNSQIWTATDTLTRISPRRIQTASAPVSVAYAATVTLDLNTGFNFDIGALTGNLTLANPTNAKAGQSGRIRVPQDGTGSRTLTVGANWKFAGGAPTLSTAASTVDIIAYYCRSSSEIEATLSKAFA